MFCLNRTHVILWSLLLSAGALAAQQAGSPGATASGGVNLDVVVAPKSGPPVADLQQSDFTVLDDKVPQHITSFRAAGGAQGAIHVILVVDAVNVGYEYIAQERGQLEKFLRGNGGTLAQPTQLAFFTDDGIQIQEGFSTDGNELNTSLDQHAIGLRNIHRSSQFQASDRLNLSITALRELIAHEEALPGRKMIFWISPGWPLLSGPGIELDFKQQNQLFATIVDISTRLRQGQITLYNVNPIGAVEGVGRSFYYESFLKGVSKPGQVELGDLSLQVLAVQSGGLALYGNNDTAALLRQCMADTRAYYKISFTPASAEHRDTYHRVEVQLSKPGLTARTLQGYYAQP
jgi:VWFA-related protein